METAGTRNAKQLETRKKRKIIIFAVEICLILIMLAVLWMVMRVPSQGLIISAAVCARAI